MSGFICPNCSTLTNIFGAGAFEAKAKEKNLAFLGKIPLDPLIVQQGDQGTPLVFQNSEHPVSIAYLRLAEQVASQASIAGEKNASLVS
jgi:ATP-binding protein involved in chromosome partitioning